MVVRGVIVDSSGGVIKSSCRYCKPYRCPNCGQVRSPGLVICRCLPAEVERYVASVCFCTLEHLSAECRLVGHQHDVAFGPGMVFVAVHDAIHPCYEVFQRIFGFISYEHMNHGRKSNYPAVVPPCEG